MESKIKSNITSKKIYHKPIYGLTKPECLKKSYRRYIDNKCSYKKCRGKSHFYNKYNKCLSIKHYNDIEPSRKKHYKGKNPRLICESTHRGSHWRYYDGKCYRKTCKTNGSVFAYYNGRCTPRSQYFKHLMNKFKIIEQTAEQNIKNVNSHSEYPNIYKNVKENVQKVKEDAQELLNKIQKDPTQSKIKQAVDENIINQTTANKLITSSNNETVIDEAKKQVSKQAFSVLENIKNRISNIVSVNKQTTL